MELDLANFAADILLAPYGKSHRDFTPLKDYKLVNTITGEVSEVGFLTELEVRNRNLELRSDGDPHRWLPAAEEI
jgi:hypothetical protein